MSPRTLTATVHQVGGRAADLDVRVNVTIGGDTDEQWTVRAANSLLNGRPEPADDLQLNITGPGRFHVGLLTRPAGSLHPDCLRRAERRR